MMLQKLNSIITMDNISTRGIFYNLHELLKNDSDYNDNFKWLDNYTNLDLDYYLGHSGEKYIAPLYNGLLPNNNPEVILGNILLNRFKQNWKDRYIAYQMEYNPINNYDMEETETVNSKITVSNTSDGNYKGFNVPSDSDYSPVSQNKTESTSQGDAKDNIRNLKRSGNIGVTSSTFLLKEYLDAHTYDFIESVMKDIDSISCLRVY